MTNEELTQIVTAHQAAIARHDTQAAELWALLAANIRANEQQRERFDAEIVNLANLLSTHAQQTDEAIQRLADTLSERFRSNGH